MDSWIMVDDETEVETQPVYALLNFRMFFHQFGFVVLIFTCISVKASRICVQSQWVEHMLANFGGKGERRRRRPCHN
jgi:hypothetical protein